jgi:uncharacterized protein
MEANPFVYSEPLQPESLIDRDAETEALWATARSGNNSRVVAPRRFGKTTLLRRVLAEAAEGWYGVYVDFFGVLTLADVAERIERAYADAFERGGLAGWFAGVRRTLSGTVRAGGGPVPASVELHTSPAAETPLLERLALPRRLHERTGARVLVVFDEFQDVLAASSRSDAVIRSEIQHHAGAASYVFAGSHEGMMRELFGDRRRAFFGQARAVDLPPLPPEAVAEYVTARFASTGRAIGSALTPFLAACEGHPQRTMLVAHLVWEATPHGHAATEQTFAEAWSRALVECRDELRTTWLAASVGQRRVLAAIAENRDALYAGSRRHGGSRGGAVATAVAALAERGDAVRAAGTATGYRLVDPLLAEFVRSL